MPKYVIDYTVDPTNLVAMPKLELLRVATDIALRIFRGQALLQLNPHTVPLELWVIAPVPLQCLETTIKVTKQTHPV